MEARKRQNKKEPEEGKGAKKKEAFVIRQPSDNTGRELIGTTSVATALREIGKQDAEAPKHWNAIYAGCCTIRSITISHFRPSCSWVWWNSWRLESEMPFGDGAWSQMGELEGKSEMPFGDGAWSQIGELEGRSSPEAGVLPLIGLRQDYSVVCLIVLTMRVIECIYLFIIS